MQTVKDRSARNGFQLKAELLPTRHQPTDLAVWAKQTKTSDFQLIFQAIRTILIVKAQFSIFVNLQSSQGMENPQNRKSCLTEGTSLSLGYPVTDFICIFFVHFFLRSNSYYRWFRRGTSEISKEIWAITGNTTRMEREAKNLHEMTRKIEIHDVWNCMASDWDVSPRFRSNVIEGHGSGKS